MVEVTCISAAPRLFFIFFLLEFPGGSRPRMRIEYIVSFFVLGNGRAKGFFLRSETADQRRD